MSRVDARVAPSESGRCAVSCKARNPASSIVAFGLLTEDRGCLLDRFGVLLLEHGDSVGAGKTHWLLLVLDRRMLRMASTRGVIGIGRVGLVLPY